MRRIGRANWKCWTNKASQSGGTTIVIFNKRTNHSDQAFPLVQSSKKLINPPREILSFKSFSLPINTHIFPNIFPKSLPPNFSAHGPSIAVGDCRGAVNGE